MSVAAVRRCKYLDYKEEKEIGSGAFGKVFLCSSKDGRDLVAKKTIAIKEDQKQYAQQEVELLRRIKNLPKSKQYFLQHVGDYFSNSKSVMYIFTEYCKHGSLRDYIKKHGGVIGDVPIVMSIMWNVSKGVEILHENAILHRDLKAANVLVTAVLPKGISVKLADFGLAKKILAKKQHMTCVGTPGYMAPEVLRGHYKGEADIYSLGALLYYLLVGQSPPDHPKLGFDSNGFPILPKLLSQRAELQKLVFGMMQYSVHKRSSISAVWTAVAVLSAPEGEEIRPSRSRSRSIDINNQMTAVPQYPRQHVAQNFYQYQQQKHSSAYDSAIGSGGVGAQQNRPSRSICKHLQLDSRARCLGCHFDTTLLKKRFSSNQPGGSSQPQQMVIAPGFGTSITSGARSDKENNFVGSNPYLFPQPSQPQRQFTNNMFGAGNFSQPQPIKAPMPKVKASSSSVGAHQREPLAKKTAFQQETFEWPLQFTFLQRIPTKHFSNKYGRFHFNFAPSRLAQRGSTTAANFEKCANPSDGERLADFFFQVRLAKANNEDPDIFRFQESLVKQYVDVYKPMKRNARVSSEENAEYFELRAKPYCSIKKRDDLLAISNDSANIGILVGYQWLSQMIRTRAASVSCISMSFLRFRLIAMADNTVQVYDEEDKRHNARGAREPNCSLHSKEFNWPSCHKWDEKQLKELETRVTSLRELMNFRERNPSCAITFH